MRPVKKLASPKNVSPNRDMRLSFAQAERAYMTWLQAKNAELAGGICDNQQITKLARSKFDNLDKAKLREILMKEQKGLCVYCERPLHNEEGRPTPAIDHWHPLSLNLKLAIHWKNLYLSCSTRDTCDGKKKDNPLKACAADRALDWPTMADYGRALGYTSEGEIYVKTDAGLSEDNRKALEASIKENILNLNHPRLVAARKAAIDDEKRRLGDDFPGRTASRIERAERANARLNEQTWMDFVSIRVCYLQKETGQGQP